VKAVPDAATLADADGDLPVHLVLGREGELRVGAESLGEILAEFTSACPACLAGVSPEGMTALHMVYIRPDVTTSVVSSMLAEDPQTQYSALDRAGSTPLHVLCAQAWVSEELLLQASRGRVCH
jgi:hypothetical protein